MTKGNWREKIGQLIMMGIAEPTLSTEEVRVIQKLQPSGIIYFRRNVQNPKQLAALSFDIYKLCQTLPLIGIDQEGGRVARLGDPFTVFPGNDHLGRAWIKTKKDSFAYRQAEAMAKELKSIGVNLNFTPVADIDTNPANPIIGSRAFSKEAKEVAKLVKTTVQAYRDQKVISCAKHFPGHGDSNADSHLVLPYIDVPKKTIMSREILPFLAAISAKVPTIMTAHVVYPQLDKVPATLSKKILQGLLRKKMGFSGVLISDDMEMSAIANSMSIPEASVEALKAGVDLLLVCKSLELAQQVYEEIIRSVENKKLSHSRVDQALMRIARMKKKYLHKKGFESLVKSDSYRWPAHQKLAEKIKDF